MANRCQFENSNDVGVFAKLTNAYCLVSTGGTFYLKIIFLQTKNQKNRIRKFL